MICPVCMTKLVFSDEGLVCPICTYEYIAKEEDPISHIIQMNKLYNEGLRDGACAYYNDRSIGDNPYTAQITEETRFLCEGWEAGFLSAKDKTEEDAVAMASIEEQSGIIEVIKMDLSAFEACLNHIPWFGKKAFFVSNINDFTDRLKKNLDQLPRIDTK